MVAPADAVLPTLFTAFRPVEEYRRWRAAADVTAEAVPLTALDAFLIGRVAAYAPASPCVLDLAADATSGDSTAMWAAAGVPVVVPRTAGTALDAGAGEWRGAFRSWLREHAVGTGADDHRVTFSGVTLGVDGADDADEWSAVAANLPTGMRVLVTLAATPDTAVYLAAHLDLLSRRLPTAWVLLFPLGETGAGPVLAHALAACPPGGERRLHALRELAPFFAVSAVALIAPVADPAVDAVLGRVRELVGGNFQFLTLVQETIAAASREAAWKAKDDTAVTTTQAAEVEQSLRASLAAQAETERSLRATLHELHTTVEEKNAYAGMLEERLAYLEGTYLPWKNEVLTGLEGQLRDVARSKAFRAERLVRRALHR